jgi:hypothetical protein
MYAFKQFLQTKMKRVYSLRTLIINYYILDYQNLITIFHLMIKISTKIKN